MDGSVKNKGEQWTDARGKRGERGKGGTTLFFRVQRHILESWYIC